MESKNFFEWKIGIMNIEEKYLTAEGYGDKVNACGTSLRQKQTWTVEFHEDETVYIRSYARNFLSVDRLGTVTCAATERGENEQFVVEYATDGSGRWAFRNKKQKHFLAGTQDKIDCLAKKASEEELSLWYTPFVLHPQLTLFSLAGKKFAIADKDGVKVSGTKAWGPHALFTLVYYCGKYHVITADNRLLCKDGTLVDTHDKDTLFGIEVHLSVDKALTGLAFKDNEGRFLSASSASGHLKAQQKQLKKETLFRFDLCHPQVSILGTEGKMAHVAFGNEVMLKKQNNEPSTSETFQLEYHGKKKKWSIETYDGTFWGVGQRGRIDANAKTVSNENLFEITWLSNGMAAIKGSNGKPLVSTGTGNLAANLPDDAVDEGFQIRLLNRPQIVFRCEFGYIGMKNATGSNKDEYICTKPFPSVITVQQMEDGKYSLQSENGKYWCINLQAGGYPSIKANSAEPVPFVLEFRDTSLVTILAPNERYMTCDKVGHFHATSTEPGSKCLLFI